MCCSRRPLSTTEDRYTENKKQVQKAAPEPLLRKDCGFRALTGFDRFSGLPNNIEFYRSRPP